MQTLWNFLSYALSGCLGSTIFLFLGGSIFGKYTEPDTQMTVIDSAIGTVLMGSIFLTPTVALVSGIVGASVPHIRKSGGLRKYIFCALVAETVGVLVLPTWVLLSPLLFPAFEQQHQSPIEDNADMEYAYVEAIKKNGGHSTQGDKLEQLTSHATLLRLLQACVDNSSPFVLGFPIIAVFTLWSQDMRQNSRIGTTQKQSKK